MKLPNNEHARVPTEKLRAYLLSETHPVGKSKAKFLRSFGFNDDSVEQLRLGLEAIARSEEISDVESSPYGDKFTVDGHIQAPGGGFVKLRTIWIIEKGQTQPRFVTAYPA